MSARPMAADSPLRYLAPAWFSIVMGLCGLSLTWTSATAVMGWQAGMGAQLIGALAAAIALLLTIASVLRATRYPAALKADLLHPARHAMVAAMPVSLLLLTTVAARAHGALPALKLAWMLGAAWQFGVTLWVLRRWLHPVVPGENAATAFWASVTPALFIPVVGNVVVPIAGVQLGFPEWSAAQFGIGIVFWPVVLALLVVRLGLHGLWPERLLPTIFITVAPSSVGGLAALELGVPTVFGWGAWGIGVFFLLWSASLFSRAWSQPFSISFWAISFPLAAFTSLTLKLAQGAPAWFHGLAVMLLALVSLLIAVLLLATWRGLRDGSLLAPESGAPVANGGACGTTAH